MSHAAFFSTSQTFFAGGEKVLNLSFCQIPLAHVWGHQREESDEERGGKRRAEKEKYNESLWQSMRERGEEELNSDICFCHTQLPFSVSELL